MTETNHAGASALANVERRQDQSLPRYGVLYLNQLCAEFSIFDCRNLPADTIRQLEGIVEKKRKKEMISWHELYLFELALARCLPAEKLAQKVLSLRTRFAD